MLIVTVYFVPFVLVTVVVVFPDPTGILISCPKSVILNPPLAVGVRATVCVVEPSMTTEAVVCAGQVEL